MILYKIKFNCEASNCISQFRDATMDGKNNNILFNNILWTEHIGVAVILQTCAEELPGTNDGDVDFHD
jgi:hypothetical protein